MTWRLVFTGLQSFTWTASVVVTILLALVMFFLLRRYEARLVSSSVGRSLLTLRVMVLVLLLLTFLKPVLTRRTDIDRQSRVVVAFDVSESMQTADRHAAPSEMLRWAQALGMLGNDGTSALLDSWVAAFDAGQQPDWGAESAENGVPNADHKDRPAPGRNPDLGAVRQQHVEGVFAELSKMPRTEFVRRLLQSRPNDLLIRLAESQNVDLRVFGLDQQNITTDQLTTFLNTSAAELNTGGTDAINVLTSAIGEPGGNSIAGIVLLSDGRQTARSDAVAEATRLGTLKIPVYCVPIGSRLTPRDLSVASLQVPQVVFLNDTAQVTATIASTGYVGDEVIVRLQKNGETVDQREISVAADHFDVEFGIPTTDVGNHEYSLVMDVQPGELRNDNNNRDFTVSVVDNKSRVMLVEGDARWEFRYLRSALERDKQCELSSVLFQQPFLQLLNDTFLSRELPKLELLKEQLANTDVLILGDVPPENIPEPVWEAIEKAVEDGGMTLVVLPGRRHMPLQFKSPTLQKLLPVMDPKEQLAERFRRSVPDAVPSVFRLQPTPEAADLTLFRLTPTDAEVRTDFSNLPGHPWAFTATPRPAATVWAWLNMEGMEQTDLAAIVHQYYGFGQVVWMGIDSTWRWRQRAGDKWHHRFWGQLIRWAARNKSASGNDQVRMTLSDVIIDESETVEVAVRWNPQLTKQLLNAVVEVLVEPVSEPDVAVSPANSAPVKSPPAARATSETGEGVAAQKHLLYPVEGAPERMLARIPKLKPGTYQVRLRIANTDIRLDDEVVSELIVQRQLSSELANISCNRAFLDQISALSQGRMLEPWQVSELPELLKPRDLQSTLIQERTVWDHWSLMLLFFLLLTSEWIIRKLNGLP